MHQQLENSDSQKAGAVYRLQLNELVNSVIHELIKAQWKQQVSTLHKLNLRKLKTSPRTQWSYFCHYQAQISFRHLMLPLTWLIACPALEALSPATHPAHLLVPSSPEGPNPSPWQGRSRGQQAPDRDRPLGVETKAYFLMWK